MSVVAPGEGAAPQDAVARAAECFWTDAGLAALQEWLAEYWMACAWPDDSAPDAAAQENTDVAARISARLPATDLAPEMRAGSNGDQAEAGAGAQPPAGIGSETRAAAQSPTTVPARVAATPPMRPYVVQRGDTLTRIAERLLGDAARWEEIYHVNRDQIRDPDNIREGMVLWVPPRNAPRDD